MLASLIFTLTALVVVLTVGVTYDLRHRDR
jgi:hypothetical protein